MCLHNRGDGCVFPCCVLTHTLNGNSFGQVVETHRDTDVVGEADVNAEVNQSFFGTCKETNEPLISKGGRVLTYINHKMTSASQSCHSQPLQLWKRSQLKSWIKFLSHMLLFKVLHAMCSCTWLARQHQPFKHSIVCLSNNKSIVLKIIRANRFLAFFLEVVFVGECSPPALLVQYTGLC